MTPTQILVLQQEIAERVPGLGGNAVANIALLISEGRNFDAQSALTFAMTGPDWDSTVATGLLIDACDAAFAIHPADV